MRDSGILPGGLLWLGTVACGLLAVASAVLVVRGEPGDRGTAAAGLLFFGAGTYALLREVRPAIGRLRAGTSRPRSSGTEPDTVLLLRSEPVRVGALTAAVVMGLGTGGMAIWTPAGGLGLVARIACWAGLVFFTGGGLVALIVELARRGPDVTLSPSGLRYRRLQRRVSLPWPSITAMAVREVEHSWCLVIEHAAAPGDGGRSGDTRTSLLPLTGATGAGARQVEWMLASYVAGHDVVVPVSALIADPERAVAAVTTAATAEHATFVFVALVHATDGPDRRRTLIAVLAADPNRLVPVAIGLGDDRDVPLDEVISVALDRADPDWATALAWHALLPEQDWDLVLDVDDDWDADAEEWDEDDDEWGEDPAGGERPSADREEERFPELGLRRTAVAVTRALVSRAPDAEATAWAMTRHAEALYLADRLPDAAAVAERAASACRGLLAAGGDPADLQGEFATDRLGDDLDRAEHIIALSLPT